MATIRITDLKLKTIIGTNDWEREEKQEIIINISFDFDARRASRSDDIRDTVDYKALKKKIMAFVESSRDYLLEKLVEDVLDLVMADKKVRAAAVRIDKPNALRFAKSVSVESIRKRR
jgi:FolB domain-containing protein